MLLAIWIGGVSGTFISAVLIGIPGSSSAIATCFDGYPMTQKGQASKALGIGMTASFIGTVCSVAIATVLSPGDRRGGSASGTLGILLPVLLRHYPYCLPVQGQHLQGHHVRRHRSAHGLHRHGPHQRRYPLHLWQCVPHLRHQHRCTDAGYVRHVQIIRDNAKGEAKMPDVDVKNMKGLGIGFKDIIENIKTIIFAFASGLWIGFLPGMGSGISNMVAYGYAKGHQQGA